MPFFFLLFCLFSSLSAEDCDHRRSASQNNFIPDLTFGISPRAINEDSAVSFLGEVGRRNFRANATYGLFFGWDKRVKVSGEYLTQKINYNFSSGREGRWMNQLAAGIACQKDFYNFRFFKALEFGAYGSYAHSRSLSRVNCPQGILGRHIAGSSSYGFSLGAVLKPWSCATLEVELDHDTVIYRRKFRHNKHVAGFGGSFSFFHTLPFDCGFNLVGEFRKPYNYIRGSVNWNATRYPGLNIGLFGSHTKGKSRLPSSTTAGIELNYTYGEHPIACEETYCGCEIPYPNYFYDIHPEMKSWIATPAVYIPEVLAIADECFVKSAGIPNFIISTMGPFSISVAPFFKAIGPGTLKFSAVGLPPGAVIDPNTGVITGIAPAIASSFRVIATATNGCSTSSQAFTITFCFGAPTSIPIPDQSFCSPDPYSFNVAPFFSNPPGSLPIVFSATGLPAGSTINPSTGLITGPNLQDNSTHSVTVTANNGCGTSSQTFTISFPCLTPFSSPIPDFIVPAIATNYSFDLSEFYTSTCGQTLTFSETGLPAGGVIDPVTGVISGPNDHSGAHSVTVTATSICGSTSQTFTLTLQ